MVKKNVTVLLAVVIVWSAGSACASPSGIDLLTAHYYVWGAVYNTGKLDEYDISAQSPVSGSACASYEGSWGEAYYGYCSSAANLFYVNAYSYSRTFYSCALASGTWTFRPKWGLLQIESEQDLWSLVVRQVRLGRLSFRT